MKLDIKSIIILLLLGVSLFFSYYWFFGDNSEYKEKVKKLQNDYEVLESEKKILDSEISKLKLKYDS
jgi:hypothetical protein